MRKKQLIFKKLIKWTLKLRTSIHPNPTLRVKRQFTEREKIFAIQISDKRYINQNKEFLQIKLRTKQPQNREFQEVNKYKL